MPSAERTSSWQRWQTPGFDYLTRARRSLRVDPIVDEEVVFLEFFDRSGAQADGLPSPIGRQNAVTNQAGSGM